MKMHDEVGRKLGSEQVRYERKIASRDGMHHTRKITAHLISRAMSPFPGKSRAETLHVLCLLYRRRWRQNELHPRVRTTLTRFRLDVDININIERLIRFQIER